MPDLTYDEQDRFVQELTSFARSGVPLPAGLRRLAETAQSGRLRELSSQVARDLEEGKPLSRALRDSDLFVSPQLVALIECGEISGEMTPILEFALEQSRKIKAHRAAIVTTLVYPFLVLITLILVVWFMLVFIVPRFADIYNQLGAQLPLQSLWIIESGRLFHGGPASLLALVLIAFLLLCILLEPLRDRVYAFIAHLPGFSRLIILSDTALFTKFVERMGTRRVPLPIILNAASLAMWHSGMRNSLEQMSAAAEQGSASAEDSTRASPQRHRGFLRRPRNREICPRYAAAFPTTARIVLSVSASGRLQFSNLCLCWSWR